MKQISQISHVENKKSEECLQFDYEISSRLSPLIGSRNAMMTLWSGLRKWDFVKFD